MQPPTHSRRVGQTRVKRVTKPGSPGGDFRPRFCVSCHLPAPQRPHLTAPLARPASRVLATPEGALRPGPAPGPSGRSWTPHNSVLTARLTLRTPWPPLRPHTHSRSRGDLPAPTSARLRVAPRVLPHPVRRPACHHSPIASPQGSATLGSRRALLPQGLGTRWSLPEISKALSLNL